MLQIVLQVLVPVGLVWAAGLDKLEGRRRLERDLDAGGRGDRAIGADTIGAHFVVVVAAAGAGVVST